MPIKKNLSYIGLWFSVLFCVAIYTSHEAFSSDDETICFDLRRDIRYGGGDSPLEVESDALFTVPQAPMKTKSQCAMVYRGRPECRVRERVLRPDRDGCTQISLTEKWPYCLHGQMSMEFDGKEYGGSGVLVGPHHFLTAGHCVYDAETGILAQNIRVHLALNGEVAPFNEALGARVYLYQQWTESKNEDFDIALVVLNRSIGFETGWAGLLCLDDSKLADQVVHVTGYPGDKGFKTMWTMDNRLGSIDRERLSYQIDTYGGQSGGAIWIKKWETPHIVGVHTTGGTASTGNFGVRLSRRKIETITTHWIAHTLEILSSSPTARNYGNLIFQWMRNLVAVGGAGTDDVVATVARPLPPVVPDIAIGHEDDYLRFRNGRLIYKPDPESDVGKIELPHSSIAKSLRRDI